MVLVKFKPAASRETIAGLFAELGKLPEVIPGIEHFSWGPYSSPEGLHGGFTHGFLMTFRDAAARDGYLPHPEHERVKQMILPHVEGVIAFDFEV
jgi:hypothetical protein